MYTILRAYVMYEGSSVKVSANRLSNLQTTSTCSAYTLDIVAGVMFKVLRENHRLPAIVSIGEQMAR
jgi:hypothetical protein